MDLCRRQVRIGLADFLVRASLLVQEDDVVDSDACALDPGLPSADAGGLRDVRVADRHLGRAHDTSILPRARLDWDRSAGQAPHDSKTRASGEPEKGAPRAGTALSRSMRMPSNTSLVVRSPSRAPLPGWRTSVR